MLDALANAMGAKPKVVKRFVEALEKVLVKELKETGSAKIPRVVVMKKAMKTARPERERKVFGTIKKGSGETRDGRVQSRASETVDRPTLLAARSWLRLKIWQVRNRV